jgi:biopolymer transport protein ExbD
MARKGRTFGNKEGGLQLTSMMDVMTIILVFLIKQIDTEGNLVTSAPNLQLPNSTSTQAPTEVSLQVIVGHDWVLVDGQQLEQTEIVRSQDSLIVGKVSEVLKEKRDIEKQAKLAAGEVDEGGGNVIVQIDKSTDYDIVYKVMATCGFSGFGNIAFAVNAPGGE